MSPGDRRRAETRSHHGHTSSGLLAVGGVWASSIMSPASGLILTSGWRLPASLTSSLRLWTWVMGERSLEDVEGVEAAGVISEESQGVSNLCLETFSKNNIHFLNLL